MTSQIQTIPVTRITPSSIVIYHLSTENYKRSEKQILNEANLTRGEYNGYMSPKTKSKVKRYLDSWFNSIEQINRTSFRTELDKKPYLTFVTLTLPSVQIHDDKKIKRVCLTPFIETLKRKYNVWNYFWRAESQANGNIHFHIVIDSYIKWQAVRQEWNDCINKLGYVDSFEAKHGHRNPNSTDIHKLNEIKSLTSYVIKYCCKEDGYRPIEGRIHGCSDKIKKLMPYEFVTELKHYDVIEKAQKYPNAYVKSDSCFTYISLPVYSFLKEVEPSIIKEMNDHYIMNALDLYKFESEYDTRQLIRNNNRNKEENVTREKMINVMEEAIQLQIDYKYSSLIPSL